VTCVLSALFQADLDGEAAGVTEMKTHEGVREGVLMVRNGGLGRGKTEIRHYSSSGTQHLPFILESDTLPYAHTSNMISLQLLSFRDIQIQSYETKCVSFAKVPVRGIVFSLNLTVGEQGM
jgi:hypothetical protein